MLILCVGNICRSPMAAGLATASLPDVRVESAGLAAVVGSPADPHAVAVLQDKGIDISSHRARQFTPALVADFELVLAMENWQVQEIDRMSPSLRGRVFRLGHWGKFEIADPYRQDRAAFERALGEIEQGLSDLKKALRIE